MDWSLLYLLPLVVAIILTVVAFRAHERYWSLGFLGWRRVYLGLGAYMAAGIISGVIYWVTIASPASGAIPWLQAGLVLFSAIGIILILYGSIERLRELSAEHAHLEDVRAGFDLFDTLREVIGQPYAFLEILDYALKEMVRAAGVDSGGLWLYNQSKSEWILTGWANLSEKLRQQTESVKGTGTGFDRLAGAHKARLFVGAEKLRSSFPEWEAEGFQSILGLPLVSGSVGSGGRQVLGAIILADSSAHRFDDDRARRLYAASDYVAAVIAEARIVRQLDSARSQLDAAYAELERERDEARKQKQAAEQQLLELRQQAADDLARLEASHQSQMTKAREEAAALLTSTREELEARHAQELKSLRDDHMHQFTAMQKRHDDELKRLREDAASERAALQTRHEEELARLREEATAVRERLEAQLTQLKQLHHEELQTVRAEYESVIDDAETVHAEELRLAGVETENVRKELEARLGEALTQQSALKQAIANLEERAAEERRNWEHRLDELHRNDQAERAKERERHDALAARLQEELTALRQRNAELTSALDELEGTAAEQAATIRSAQATLAEREEMLKAERRSREELAASHKDALAVLQSRLDAATRDLVDKQEQISSLQRDLEHAQEATAAIEATLAHERDRMANETAALHAELNDERAAAQRAREELGRELESVRLLLEERERQLTSWRDAHRDACAESRSLEERIAALEQERNAAQQHAESALAAEAERRAGLEAELAALHAERTALEERRQRELVEERLDHRRRLHKIEFEMATLRERLQRALAVPDAHGRVETLVRCIAERIPSSQVYIWQRTPDGSARMIGWMNEDRELFEGQDLPPWTFELDTIPAEGITELTDSIDLIQRLNAHSQDHLDRWLTHWGPNARPIWSICWPWQGTDGRSIGWVTVFGFDVQPPSTETVDEVDTWVGLVGAAVQSVHVQKSSAAPEPSPGEIEGKATDPSQSVERSETASHDETQSDTGVGEADEESAPVPAPTTERRWIDLHNVILNWAAHQTEDALRLDLTAQPGITVDESWLRNTLEHGRQICRESGGLGGELIVSTHRQNGHTVLRLLRGGESSENEQSTIAAVEDTELITDSTDDLEPSSGTDHDSPVSGRWLVRDGNRIGMELRFSHHSSETDQHADAENQQVARRLRTVLVTDDDDSMVELVTGMLDSLGDDALTAANRDQAQDQLRAHDVDAVIINASMGGGTGWNVARWFKDANPQLPVVLVVGAETMSIPDDFPGDWMLRLPFQIDELRECLDSLMTVKT
ncbi:MAG: hypothetical protein Kow0074_14020 [Candidatus Zixiibacteriota bacterium]